ncbi:MAG: hydantoinase B/oxoprolinase family protein [Chloroflexi bacterium]|nr:hydantoinase B/oxoprolinase family protein [Chloroflexota bacterium]
MVTVDPITTEIVRSKFEALLREMRFLLVRSAFSTLMRESRDCSFGICSALGEMPFQEATHLHIYGRAARRLMAKVPPNELHDGDVYIGNDPHEIGVAHTPDILVLSPVIYRGTLVGFCGSAAHKVDIGGVVPGSVYNGASEIFQEGLVLPLMKFYDRGRVVPQVEDVIRINVRNPDLVLGDLGAQVGVTLVGVQRVRALAERYGAETLQAVFQELPSLSERRIRRVVEQWPGEVAEAETLLDPPPNHDRPVKFHVRITRDGGHLTFDFSGSDAQIRSPINMPITIVLHICCLCLLGMTDPSIPENAGVARAISLVAREGTVLNPVSPAPVGNTTVVFAALIDVVLNALAALKGETAVAERGGHGTTALLWYGGLVPGRTYVQYEVQTAATGACARADGVAAVNPHVYAYSRRSMDTRYLLETPVEILEAQYPVRIRRYELIPDSGGPGKFRGGVAPRRFYEALAPALLNVRHAKSFEIPAQGTAGGKPGSKGRVVVNLGTSSETEVPSWSYELRPGDTLAFEGGGGGGFGDPKERDPQLVAQDVVEGCVSPEGARRDYGVAVQFQDGKVTLDAEATSRLRARIGSLPRR